MCTGPAEPAAEYDRQSYKECQFLVAHWRFKGLDWELLSHVMSKADCVTKTRNHEEDHFLDRQADEEAAAQALQDGTKLALHGAAEDDASGVKNLEKTVDDSRLFEKPVAECHLVQLA